MSFIPGADGDKSIFKDGIQVDHLSENTVGHSIVFNNDTTFNGNIVFDPTLLSNTQATKMGRKSYRHGTAYNGGISPTMSGWGGSPGVVEGIFVPYQMQDGTWRMKGQMWINGFTGVNSLTLSIVGVTYATYPALWASAAEIGNGPVAMRQYIAGSTIQLQAYAGASFTEANLFFDVGLASKPTWAY